MNPDVEADCSVDVSSRNRSFDCVNDGLAALSTCVKVYKQLHRHQPRSPRQEASAANIPSDSADAALAELARVMCVISQYSVMSGHHSPPWASWSKAELPARRAGMHGHTSGWQKQSARARLFTIDGYSKVSQPGRCTGQLGRTVTGLRLDWCRIQTRGYKKIEMRGAT